MIPKLIYGFNKNQIAYCYVQKPKETKSGFWHEEQGHPWRLFVVTISKGEFVFDFDTEEECLDVMHRFELILIDRNNHMVAQPK
jgi:hypothetical protein